MVFSSDFYCGSFAVYFGQLWWHLFMDYQKANAKEMPTV
jgi:hypothetical protein